MRARGGRVVVVDPRRTETAAAADEHLAIRPGTDALLLAAMLQVIVSEGWVRLGRLAGRVRHFDALAAFVRDLPPERVARRTGIAPATIRRLAAAFAHAGRAACYGRVGLCTQRDGTLAAWLQQALNLVTGRVDEAGGMLLPTPAVDVVGILARLGWRGTFDRWRSRARGLPEFGGELPVAALADEIELAGPRSVRALITVAGNPVAVGPERTPPRARAGEPGARGRGRPVPQRDHPPRPTSCCRPRRRSRAPTTTSPSTPLPCATRRSMPSRWSRGLAGSATTGRSWRSSVDARSRRGRFAGWPREPPGPCAQSGSWTSCCGPDRTA